MGDWKFPLVTPFKIGIYKRKIHMVLKFNVISFSERNRSRGGYKNFKNSSCSVKESLTGWYSIIVSSHF